MDREKEKMQGKTKAVVSVISIILVVGVLIGVVVGLVVNRHGSKGSDKVSSSAKAVAAICAPTEFKDICTKSLGPVAHNVTATPKDFVQAAINATIEELHKAFNLSGQLLAATTNDTKEQSALNVCKDFLNYSLLELEDTLGTVVNTTTHNSLAERIDDFRNWLGAVLAYQETCLDGLKEVPNLQSPMANALVNGGQLTSNALAIVTELTEIYKAFNIEIQVNHNNDNNTTTTSSRRLLGTTDGYPTWVSAADRKLLATDHAGNKINPHAVVAKDGSGQYTNISAALKAYPKGHQGRFIIYVKGGVYKEQVTVERHQSDIFMYGDGPAKTVVTGNKSVKPLDTLTTPETATFTVYGPRFMAKNIGFENTAGPQGHQAVALRVHSDNSVFYQCRMAGYQDTLYAHNYQQYYQNCIITGTVDFIFGDAICLIQNSLIIVRRGADGQKNIVTAQGRKNPKERGGIVIHTSRIVPDMKLFAERFKIETYLGRPWKDYSRTIIMESELGDFIQPVGWTPWDDSKSNIQTVTYREFANSGPGADTKKRVNWRGYRAIKDRVEALPFTAGKFLKLPPNWLTEFDIPFNPGFKKQ